jgi:hypothetical protein
MNHPIFILITGWVPGVKRPESEADHSSQVIAEVKKNLGLYSHSPIRLHGLELVKHGISFTFLGIPSDGLRAGRPGFDSQHGRKMFCSSERPERLLGPPSLLSNGYWKLFPRR